MYSTNSSFGMYPTTPAVIIYINHQKNFGDIIFSGFKYSPPSKCAECCDFKVKSKISVFCFVCFGLSVTSGYNNQSILDAFIFKIHEFRFF